jgi:hypothetical protein
LGAAFAERLAMTNANDALPTCLHERIHTYPAVEQASRPSQPLTKYLFSIEYIIRFIIARSSH